MTERIAPPSRKGVERKAQILDAALLIIGRDGLGGLTMRSLAAEAGIPLGALSYYFANKDELVLQAFEAHSQRELRRVMRSVASIGTAGSAADLADALADFAIEGLAEAQLDLVAEYEYVLEASRRPELARASNALRQALQTLLAEVLTRLGSDDPETDARIIVTVMGGVEVDNLTGTAPTSAQRDSIRAMMSRVLGSLNRAWQPVEVAADHPAASGIAAGAASLTTTEGDRP